MVVVYWLHQSPHIGWSNDHNEVMKAQKGWQHVTCDRGSHLGLWHWSWVPVLCGLLWQGGSWDSRGSFLFFSFHFFYNIHLFKKVLFIYFLERGEGREKERDRNINVWLPLMWPPLETWPTTQACALSGNRTRDPLIHSPRSIHWATPARARDSFLNSYLCSLWYRPAFNLGFKSLRIKRMLSPHLWPFYRKQFYEFDPKILLCHLLKPVYVELSGSLMRCRW